MAASPEFAVVVCQAFAYTPREGLPTSKILSEFYPRIVTLFDAEPMVFPTVQGLPRDMPRVLLRNASGNWGCDIASSRIQITYRSAWPNGDAIEIPWFFHHATQMIQHYHSCGPKFGRLGATAERVARMAQPAQWLAEHFCSPQWLQGVMANPKYFELHVHKLVEVGPFRVNLWARNRVVEAIQAPVSGDIMTLDHDISTLAEAENVTVFATEQVDEFFRLAGETFERELAAYYPGDEK